MISVLSIGTSFEKLGKIPCKSGAFSTAVATDLAEPVQRPGGILAGSGDDQLEGRLGTRIQPERRPEQSAGDFGDRAAAKFAW